MSSYVGCVCVSVVSDDVMSCEVIYYERESAQEICVKTLCVSTEETCCVRVEIDCVHAGESGTYAGGSGSGTGGVDDGVGYSSMNLSVEDHSYMMSRGCGCVCDCAHGCEACM